MKYNELKRKLTAAGCYEVRKGGNHDIWFSPITKKNFPVARHQADEVPSITLKKIKANPALQHKNKRYETSRSIY